MVLWSRLQSEMDQRPYPERRLVAYRPSKCREAMLAHNSLSIMRASSQGLSFVIETGAIKRVLDKTLNISEAIVEGLDYEAIYILDFGIFGHGDFGRLTWTVNGTYLSRFEFQGQPNTRRFGLSGQFIFRPARLPARCHTTELLLARSVTARPIPGSLVSILVPRFTSPANMKMTISLLTGAKTGSFPIKGQTPRTQGKFILDENGNPIPNPNAGLESPFARKVAAWVTLDLIASYTFNLPPPAAAQVPGLAKDGGKNVKMDGKEKNVLPVSTAEYYPCGWRAWLNGTTSPLECRTCLMKTRRSWLARSKTTSTNRLPISKAGSGPFS